MDTGTSPTRLPHDPTHIAPEALTRITAFHADVLERVQKAVRDDAVVVIGMAQNPHVKKARKALADANIPFTYLEFGSYFSAWRQRLAIKLWSGWPTFPQVFVRGVLLGGAELTKAAIEDGSLKKRMERGTN